MKSSDSAGRFLALQAMRPEPKPVEVEQAPVASVLPRKPVPRRKQAPRKRPAHRPKHERMPITSEQILALRASAEAGRDRLFAGVCDRALRDDMDAVNACKAALYGLA